ncbi:GH92 family glycosyl hydrolase [Pinibacter aurantiacus]|uniref:GH92 family glycosyl hydrolase n=1 Tax=Pinibacter aurantiacus TaxID=2851599 RepID=A0A9E2SCM0_9BACT|nr:GH92 family glycosyl hydrolase [Pinibacter aurantiacus]MBV4357430.1 GH92 family glycosyl hydrolase [Pinibacter aurantiacus]
MKKKFLSKQGILLLLLQQAVFTGVVCANVPKDTTAPKKQNIDYIDPTIGNIGQLLEPTRPTAQLPNQVIRMYPIRKDYLDDQISSFPLTIVSHRLGEVFSVKPSVKELAAENWSKRMPYDHNLEITRPWYYSTYLIEDGITVEFTPSEKSGYYRFSFPEGKNKFLLFSNFNDGAASWKFSGNVLQGMETYHNDIRVYTYGVFNVAGTTGYVDSNKAIKNASSITEGGARPYINFPASARTVELKYAISFVSAEQAKKNFEEEIASKDFATVEKNAKTAWSDLMAQIKIEGGTEAQRRSFYTALYRCHERMVDISEDAHYYSGYNKKINTDNRPFYVDDWSWDTYLALHPLRTILHPKQEEDMLQSYVRMYEQSGWMPTFPVLFGDHACMNGFHSSIVFLDAYRKGLKNYDVEKAYEGIRKNATDATMLPWRNGPKTSLDDFYHNNGYFPALRDGEQETVKEVHSFEKRQAVAVTLGGAFDDWALAELAKDLNKTSDYNTFEKRGQNYRNLWNKQTNFFLPKDDKGNWILIDPKFDGGLGGRDYYDENNGWTYMWQVQQDIPGLIGLMGGRDSFELRLDQLFREGLDRSKYEFWAKFPDATGLVGQYSMGNEPSFHIPYLYNYTSSPWKTQQKVRSLLSLWFKDNVFGIPGDEDGGGMSAFVVFSSMGFYPMTPGIPVYTIGSPVFSKVSIALENGKTFTLIAHNSNEVNKYIQSAKLNGKVLKTPWFTHDQLVSGCTIELEMGPKPNKTWGTDVKPAKPFAKAN